MIKKVFKNKKGSMMFEYFIITTVGVLLLGAFIGFLGEGEKLVENTVKQVKKTATTDDSNLGKFK